MARVVAPGRARHAASDPAALPPPLEAEPTPNLSKPADVARPEGAGAGFGFAQDGDKLSLTQLLRRLTYLVGLFEPNSAAAAHIPSHTPFAPRPASASLAPPLKKRAPRGPPPRASLPKQVAARSVSPRRAPRLASPRSRTSPRRSACNRVRGLRVGSAGRGWAAWRATRQARPRRGSVRCGVDVMGVFGSRLYAWVVTATRAAGSRSERRARRWIARPARPQRPRPSARAVDPLDPRSRLRHGRRGAPAWPASDESTYRHRTACREREFGSKRAEERD
jgi:hypothetical protein